MNTAIANLGDAGWIQNPTLMATTLIRYYFLGSTDLDYLHTGTIGTMGNDIAGSGNTQDDIMPSIKISLERRFTAAFDDVTIEVDSVDTKTISLSISFRKKGDPTAELVDLAYVLDNSSGFMELMRYNQSGGVIEYDKLQS